MENLKIDRTKLLTPSSFAKQKGVERQTVYNWIKSKQIESVTIDGVLFVCKK